jgi:hypothetical protein
VAGGPGSGCDAARRAIGEPRLVVAETSSSGPTGEYCANYKTRWPTVSLPAANLKQVISVVSPSL